VLPGFTLSVVAGHPVLVPSGELDLATLPRWHDALVRAIEQHPRTTLLVDLDGVGAIDDLAIGVLLSAAARSRDRGGDLQLVATSAALRARLVRLGLDRALPVRDRLAP
jgi:anti-anti-sigma factor